MPRLKIFDTDKWLKCHMQKLVDTFAGEYIVVADGKIYHGGAPSQLREKAKAEHPHAKILGMRVPYPKDFVCALIML